MKTLVTIITPDIAEHCVEIKANHGEYAQRHGYTYVCTDGLHWPDLAASFSKIWCVQEALRNPANDVVIWADADVAFTNMTVDLAHLLTPDYWIALYSQQNAPWGDARPYGCAGLMVIRNDERSREFFAEVARRIPTLVNTAHPFEQWYVHEIMVANQFAGVHLCNTSEIGGFSREYWNDGFPWIPGCPTVHISASGNWGGRRQALVQKYLPAIVR